MDENRRQMTRDHRADDAEKGEPPQWDGSEAELVADEDAAEYEEQHTGIKLSYVLTRQEIYEALRLSGVYKHTGKRLAAESVVLFVIFLAFLLSGLVQGRQGENLLRLSVLCLLLIGILWLVPWYGLNARAKTLADGKKISLEIFPDIVQIGKGAGYWEIPLDGSAQIAFLPQSMALHFEDKLLIIPLRSVEPAVLPEVHAMLVAGTERYED